METVENNKLIAEFMGSKYINIPYTDNDGNIQDFWHWSKPENGWPVNIYGGMEMSTAFMIENWFYHSSWDWLMPVVDKIESLGNQIAVFNKAAAISNCKNLNLFSDSFKGETKIEATYKAIVRFIKWHNT